MVDAESKEKKRAYGNPSNAPQEIRWLHEKLCTLESLTCTIEDEDFKNVLCATRCFLTAAHREYNYQKFERSKEVGTNLEDVRRLGGFFAMLLAELPRGSVSDFVADSFKKENIKIPPYQELVDDLVGSVVFSFRNMLSDYHILEKNKRNACARERSNSLSAGAQKMETLKVMLRIVTNAFEAIFQRIQCIQFKMNGELSAAIEEKIRRRVNYLIAENPIDQIKKALPSQEQLNEYQRIYDMMPRIHLIRAYRILEEHKDVVFHAEQIACTNWEIEWAGDKQHHDEDIFIDIEDIMTWQFDAYRSLEDDNCNVIENKVWDCEPESSKDEETSSFGRAAKKLAGLADGRVKQSWDELVFNAPDKIVELGDWSQLEDAVESALGLIPVNLSDFGKDEDFQEVTYKLLQTQTEAIRSNDLSILEKEIKLRNMQYFEETVNRRDPFKSSLPALFLNDQLGVLDILKNVYENNVESDNSSLGKMTALYTEIDERRRLCNDVPEQWVLLKTLFRSLICLRNNIDHLPLGDQHRGQFQFRLDSICVGALMEKAKMLRMMDKDEECERCIFKASELLEDMQSSSNKEIRYQLRILNVISIDDHDEIMSLTKKYQIDQERLVRFYDNLVDNSKPYRLLVGSGMGTLWYRASCASKIAFLLGNMAIRDNKERLDDQFYGAERIKRTLDFVTTEDARHWLKRACDTADLCRPGDNFQKRKCYFALAEFNDEHFRHNSMIFARKDEKGKKKYDGEKTVLVQNDESQKSQTPKPDDPEFQIEFAISAIERYGDSIIAGHRLDRMCLFKIIELVFHVADAVGDSASAETIARCKEIFDKFGIVMTKIPPELILTIITQIIGRLSHSCNDLSLTCAQICCKMAKVFPHQMSWYFLNFYQSHCDYKKVRDLETRNQKTNYDRELALWENKGRKGNKPSEPKWSEASSRSMRTSIQRGKTIYKNVVSKLCEVDKHYARIFRSYCTLWLGIDQVIDTQFPRTVSSLRGCLAEKGLFKKYPFLLRENFTADFDIIIPTKAFMRPKPRNTRLLEEFDVNFSPFQTVSKAEKATSKNVDQTQEDLFQTADAFFKENDSETIQQVSEPGAFEHISDTEFLRERFNTEFDIDPKDEDDERDVDNKSYEKPDTSWKKPWHPDHVSIVSILDEVLELSSQQKPKRLNFLGSDGHSYSFLLKKGDDLNLDSRIGETFELFDYLLQQEKESRDENMTLRSYNVVPIGHKRGIIEWVDDLWSFKKCLQPYFERKGYHMSHLQWTPPAEGPERTKSFEDIKKKAGPPVFHQWFIENFPTAGEWYEARSTYQKSLAVTSIVGSIIGLGDRHCENIQICQKTAEVVHIDLNMIFLKGRLLKVPEIVPFRLTRNIIDGLGPAECDGLFRKSALITIRMAKDKGKLLRTVFSLVLRDPTCKWDKIRSKMNVVRSQDESPIVLQKQSNMLKEDRQAAQDLSDLLKRVHCFDKYTKKRYTPSSYFDLLIEAARSDANLYKMYRGWAPHM